MRLQKGFEQTGPYSKAPWFSVSDLFCFGSEYVEVYRGLGGVAPKVAGFGE